MSSFEDVETQNGRRFWADFERIEPHRGPLPRKPTRPEMRGRVRGIEVDHNVIAVFPPRREPRTALWMFVGRTV